MEAWMAKKKDSLPRPDELVQMEIRCTINGVTYCCKQSIPALIVARAQDDTMPMDLLRHINKDVMNHSEEQLRKIVVELRETARKQPLMWELEREIIDRLNTRRDDAE